MRIGISAARLSTLDRPATVRAAAAAAEKMGYSSFWVPSADVQLLAAAADVTRWIDLGVGPVDSPLGELAADVARRTTVALGSRGANQTIASAYRSRNVAGVLVGSRAPAVDLVVCRADGWLASGLSPAGLAAEWAQVQDVAARHGRDPEALRLVVRAGVPAGTGDIEEVAGDIAATAVLGADEVVLGIEGEVCLDRALDVYARIAEAVARRTPAPVA